MNVNLPTDFERQDCISCGVIFLIPVILGKTFRQNKQSFYCPNGHAQSYSESVADKLRRELSEEKQRRQNADQRLANLLEQQRKTVYDLEQCQNKLNKKKVKAKK